MQKIKRPLLKQLSFIFLLLSLHALSIQLHGQMRQVYQGIPESNEVYKLSFYSPTSGYVAFRDRIAFTADSGRTFVNKPIANVDYGSYVVDDMFGFQIEGIKAFDQNNILVWGEYWFTPAILRSTNGGNSYTLVFHSRYNGALSGHIMGMVFPQDNNTGYAIDINRVIKTTNNGQTWTVVHTAPGSMFNILESPDNNTVFAGSTEYDRNKLIRSTNGGTSWQNITYPVASTRMSSVFFRTGTKGWLNIHNDDNDHFLYTTNNSGTTWTPVNDVNATPFATLKMKFIDDNTGYAISDTFTILKTTNGGAVWEPLPRDNNFSYLFFTHTDIQTMGTDQLWAGGRRDFIELSTNAGGTPMPKAFFKVDTAGLAINGIVNLRNYSKTGYTYQWFKNNVPIATTYDASYTRDPLKTLDTIKLVVSNGVNIDSIIKYAIYTPKVLINSFSPVAAGTGTVVTISGSHFTNVTAVRFGGVNASSYTVVSPNTITAVVGITGASGSVTVNTANGTASLAGFTYIPAPGIISFNPTSAPAGSIITVTGVNFNGTTAVTVGGRPANYQVISNTTINVTVPSGGSGSITITTPGGVATITGYYSVPTVTAFTPHSGTHGTVMTITGTSFNEVSAITVGGVPVISFAINAHNTITAIVGAGASGDVVVTTPYGNSTLSSFTWFAPPSITSFTPVSGPIGTTITITGNNFDTDPANNTVYFGTALATVTAATSTSLTVIVPAGAPFQPISVTTNKLTAYSSYPFIVTFADGGSITQNSFATTVSMNPPTGNFPHDVIAGDVDGDGKQDLIVMKFATLAMNNAILLYRNNGTGNTVSFEAPITLFPDIGDTEMVFSDLDGDGKQDFAFIRNTTIKLFRNISTPGNPQLQESIAVEMGGVATGLLARDLDGDGKPELVAASGGAAILRNISEAGAFAFAPVVRIPGGGSRNIVAADLNGDNKPEIIIPTATDTWIYILQNNCTKGNIVFTTSALPGYTHSYIATGDMDGDGKTDIVTGDHNGSKMGVYRNLGNFLFSPVNLFDAGFYPTTVEVSDLDGDGKPDIAYAIRSHSTGVLKNTSTPGNISFAPAVNYMPGSFGGEHMIAIADFNGDGKNDIAGVNEPTQSITIHVNDVKPEPFIESFTPTSGDAGTVVNILGNNFTNVSAVSFGGIPATSFTVNSPTSITATVGAGTSGNVSVTNNFGTGVRPGFAFGVVPVITSISPVSGPAGTEVTITGSGFGNDIASNTVFFGNMKATIVSASSTSIVAKAPAGFTNQPVIVNINNLQAYSAKMFTLTFPGGGASFTAASFATRIERNEGGRHVFSDMDGDGKPDLVKTVSATSFGIARNLSTPGNISFAANANFPVTISPGDIVSGDLDGDNKPDIVITSASAQSIATYRNMSTPGNMAMSAGTAYATGVSTPNPNTTVIHDVDADGKPDVIVSNYNGRTLSVFKNHSVPGTILLGTRIDLLVPGYATAVRVRDIDGDNKPDLIASVNSAAGVAIFRNTSITGTISFANYVEFTAGNWPGQPDIGDMDGDGKLDIAIMNINGPSISVLRNLSTPGTISFASKVDYTTGASPTTVTLGDLDGDGLPEMLSTHNSLAKIGVFKNNSASGSIAVLPRFDYTAADYNRSGSIVDIDGDGIPDLAFSQSNLTTAFMRNLTGAVDKLNICPGGSTSITSPVTGSAYQWQINTGAGFVNLANDANHNGAATSTLQLIAVPSSWYGYQYRCIVNGNAANSFVIKFSNTWTGAVNTAWENPGNWSCGFAPDENTDVVINTGNPQISSNVTIRSLTLAPGITFTVNTGFTLTITH
jgi:photosystem II stability/assembly factor-like uncharacterized protein